MYAWRKLYIKAEDTIVANSDKETVRIKSENQSTYTEGVHAIVNQTNNMIAKEGHFYAPFLIRYCYRLYDGSMVMHSAPLYMNVALPESLKVYCINANKLTHINGQPVADGDIVIRSPEDGGSVTYEEDGHDYTFEFGEDDTILQYVPNNVGIEYDVSSGIAQTVLLELQQYWSDIVSSVDIFVSAPLLREDFGELITQLKVEKDTYGVRSSNVEQFKASIGRTEGNPLTPNRRYTCNVAFDFPMLSQGAYLQKVLNTSNFFKIASYKVEDFKTAYPSYVSLEYDKSIIPNITVQEEMKDDYHTHNQLLPINGESGMYVYNHRLNLYGMKEQLFKGFSAALMSNVATDGFHGIAIVTVYGVTVELNTEAGLKYVHYDDYHSNSQYCLSKVLWFYPDSRATRIFINYQHGSQRKTAVLKMQP